VSDYSFSAPPDGESYAQLLVRVREWHAGVAATHNVIVAAHGGSMKIATSTDELDHGTTVTVRVPLG